MTEESKQESLWDVNDVAAFLKCDVDTVYKWKAQGRIPHVKVGNLLRFRPSEIRPLAVTGLPAVTEEPAA